jgi:hypothetical protein
MTAARDLAGLVASGRDARPERTVAGPPPRRRAAVRDTSPADAKEPEAGFDMGVAPPTKRRAQRSRRTNPERVPDAGTRTSAPSNTVRISVNIPVACKHWLAQEAREQRRFVSELVMEALDRHGDEVSPPSGRAKRAAVPDGTIYNIVLPLGDRDRLDDLVAGKNTTRSALVTEVLIRASRP